MYGSGYVILHNQVSPVDSSKCRVGFENIQPFLISPSSHYTTASTLLVAGFTVRVIY